ncbi:Integrase catalytic region (plasmid) [Bacillus methanolicus PB1]|uniref:Integrase catalytic region n=1 Tax=Bacillus methanolicus PB1 TaxID=997296 RepID=I3DTP0_BACMT|nr:IS30 family transposase [Bacillus methanolicus]EIJ77611.1 Integrase catalytic region [Bacillus methanolicus PB1]
MVQTQSTTKKRLFKHLTPFDRGKIAALRAEGKSLQAIADAVGCHKSTISRELKRGTVTQMKTGGKLFEAYFPDTGQLVYEKNRKACSAKFKLDDAMEFIQFAEAKILRDGWSPDAVCGYTKSHGLFEGALISTKTLYNYIDIGLIGIKNIDLPMKVRLNTRKKQSRQNKRVLGRSIEERPAEVNDRQEFGHWEIDTVIGKKSNDQALLTITERKTRKEIIIRVDAKDAPSISDAISCLKKNYGEQFPKVFKTITADNGSEFADQTIAYEESWCNRLPRRILGYRTPDECFKEELALLAS